MATQNKTAQSGKGFAEARTAFPKQPQFSGFMKPCRFQGEVYRVMPDPQLPPMGEDDPWFNGDGNVSAFRLSEGKCHFKQRYVQTEKFVREREAQRALLGKYRNKFTDAVEFKVRSTANTNILYFNGRLLACKEDSPPYAMDPETLDTIGLDTFDGQLPSVTFTAHPKVDPVTGELSCFGYEALGDGTPDVCYFTFDASGKLTETVWLVSPVVAMIHDFAVTENWILFPLIPQLCDLERMKQGGEHWQWNSDVPFYIGVLPRRGAKPSDVKWYRAPNAFPGHTCNAYEDEAGKIVFDLPLSKQNVFFWWPDGEGKSPSPETISSDLLRYTIDPQTDKLDLPEPQKLSKTNCEFPRIDDRYQGRKHSHAFLDIMDPSLGTNFPAILPVMSGGFAPYNALAHYDYGSSKLNVYFPGREHMVQEPVFIPRSKDAGEGDGFVLALVNNYGAMTSELHIVDTRNFSKAVAVIELPLRLRAGLHGNWVDAADVK